jgi:hypothetical protein
MVLAVGVPVVGWLLALLFAGMVRRGLGKTSVDNRIAGWLMGKEPEGQGRARALDRPRCLLDPDAVRAGRVLPGARPDGRHRAAQPVPDPDLRAPAASHRTGDPHGGGVAGGDRPAVRRASRARSDPPRPTAPGIRRPRRGERAVPLSETLGEAVYWLVFLLFLPAILGTLALQGLLQPAQSMVDEMLRFSPTRSRASGSTVCSSHSGSAVRPPRTAPNPPLSPAISC